MQLIVERSVKESKRKGGFLGTGEEKIHRTYILALKLEDVTARQKELLHLYTYVTKGGNRNRLINLDMPVMSEKLYQHFVDQDLLVGPRYVTIPRLMAGVTWKCSYLAESFVEIPQRVAQQIQEDILHELVIGELWEESGREVLKIGE